MMIYSKQFNQIEGFPKQFISILRKRKELCEKWSDRMAQCLIGSFRHGRSLKGSVFWVVFFMSSHVCSIFECFLFILCSQLFLLFGDDIYLHIFRFLFAEACFHIFQTSMVFSFPIFLLLV